MRLKIRKTWWLSQAAPPIGARKWIENVEMPQLDHLAGQRVVHLGHLAESAGVMPTMMRLPTRSADRIRTQPSTFPLPRTAVRRYGTKTAGFDDRIRT